MEKMLLGGRDLSSPGFQAEHPSGKCNKKNRLMALVLTFLGALGEL